MHDWRRTVWTQLPCRWPARICSVGALAVVCCTRDHTWKTDRPSDRLPDRLLDRLAN